MGRVHGQTAQCQRSLILGLSESFLLLLMLIWKLEGTFVQTKLESALAALRILLLLLYGQLCCLAEFSTLQKMFTRGQVVKECSHILTQMFKLLTCSVYFFFLFQPFLLQIKECIKT